MSEIDSPAEAAAPGPVRRKRRIWWRILRLILNTVRNGCTLAVIGYIAISLRYDRARMVSDSMGPTIQGEEDRGDWVLVDRHAYRSRPPERGDLVQFRSTDEVDIIKRVAGVPGEMVQIEDGRLIVNGRIVTDPPVFRRLWYENAGFLLTPERKMKVRPGWYFVLGDNTRESYDSRFFGGVEARRIRGRAAFVYWPLKRLGPVR